MSMYKIDVVHEHQMVDWHLARIMVESFDKQIQGRNQCEIVSWKMEVIKTTICGMGWHAIKV